MNYLTVNILGFFIVLFFSFGKLYSQHDTDSLRNILDVWYLENDFNKTKSSYNDSILDFFHISKAEEQHGILNSSLGNIASASVSDNFFKRIDNFNNDFIFNEPYFLFLKNSQNVSYFNTRKPYTSIMHTTSTKLRDLQTIDFIHTQNITPYFNFGIDYDFITSLGYTEEEKGNQSTKMNSVGFSSNYKRDRYHAYFSYTFNKINNVNSGGYVDTIDEVLELPSSLISAGANIIVQNQDLTYTHIYKLGNYKNLSYEDTIIKVLEPKIGISHSFSIKRKFRVYTDEESENGTYYPINHYQSDATMDSIGMRILGNKLKIGSEEILEKEKKIGFGLIYELKMIEIFNFQKYFFLDNSKTYRENNLSGSLSLYFLNKLPIEFYSDYRMTGYRSGDYRLGINLKRYYSEKHPQSHIVFHANISNQNADYFHTHFYSNHYIWENDLAMQQTLYSSLGWLIPEIDFSIHMRNSNIKNYIHLFSEGENRIDIRQETSNINVTAVSLSKIFRLSNITFSNKVIWQNSSHKNVLSLPLFAFYHSIHFKLKLASDVKMFAGADVYYSTAYKMKSFNPAIGQFYFENDETALTGEYPFVSIFADFKIKRNVLLYFRYSNMASLFSNYKIHRTVKNYLIYGTSFNFGIKWTFKN